MKQLSIFAAFAVISVLGISMLACPPAPVAPSPDAACDASVEAKKACPACPCAQDAAPPVVSDSGPIVLVDAAPGPILLPCQAACANLRVLSCAEGFGFDGGGDCETWLCKASITGLVNYNVPCLEKASSKAAVRACALSGQTKKPLTACP